MSARYLRLFRDRVTPGRPWTLPSAVRVLYAHTGDLVVGDSHDYRWSPSPFSDDSVDDLMLAELHAILRLGTARVVERWSGTYASLPDRPMIREAPEDGVRLVIVTSGSGASTGFAIAFTSSGVT